MKNSDTNKIKDLKKNSISQFDNEGALMLSQGALTLAPRGHGACNMAATWII
jgi:hypothetical protein